jgi:hypothetical protein
MFAAPQFRCARYAAGFALDGVSSCFFDRSAKILYFWTKPLSRSAEAGSDAMSINMRKRSARARQYSERSVIF